MDTASGTPQAYPSTPGLYHLTIQAEGQTVYYTLRIPEGYDGSTALPVILCLHFGGQPSEFYGGRFLNLIPGPGFGNLAVILVAPTTEQSGWATPTGEAAAFAALSTVEEHLRVDTQVVYDLFREFSALASTRGLLFGSFSHAHHIPQHVAAGRTL
jgi:hypothetical protein